jgi:hypothetical protein
MLLCPVAFPALGPCLRGHVDWWKGRDPQPAPMGPGRQCWLLLLRTVWQC